MNLILIEPGELAPDGVATLTGARARHLGTVLEATCGQTVRVGVIDGPRGQGVVTAIDLDTATLRCRWESGVPLAPSVDLLLALPRPKVLNRLWAQVAAIGVGRIFITNAERVERNFFATHVLDPVHYRPRLVEGLQQAQDTRVPLVTIHKQFRTLVEDELDMLVPTGTRLVADPSGNQRPRDVLAQPGAVLLAVGPEGGWSRAELALLESRGFAVVAMGRRTLRSDTACIALLALVHEACRPDAGARGPSSAE